MSDLKLTVCGDIYPDKTNQENLMSGKYEDVFCDVLTLLKNSDLVIGNLEAPVAGDGEKIQKCGPHFCIDEESLNGLFASNIKYLSLANNHIMDYGREGIEHTVKTLRKYKIGTVGVGKDIRKAFKPLIIEKNGYRIAVFAAAEDEGQVALSDSWGTANIDIEKIRKEISNIRKTNDFIMIFLHGGREFYRYPTPRMCEQSRLMIDLGADCVIWSHSHCSSGVEYYKSGFIAYELGNFLLNYKINYKHFFWGHIIQINLKKNKVIYEIIPYKQFCNGKRIALLSSMDLVLYLKEIDQISEIVCSSKKLNKEFESLCLKCSRNYMADLLGYSRLYKKIYPESPKSDSVLYDENGINLEDLNKLKSMLRSETHRELLLKIIDMEIEKKC